MESRENKIWINGNWRNSSNKNPNRIKGSIAGANFANVFLLEQKKELFPPEY